MQQNVGAIFFINVFCIVLSIIPKVVGRFHGGNPPKSCEKFLICPYIDEFPPMVEKIWIFKSCRKKVQNAYPIQNVILNIFAVRDGFHVSNGLRDIRV